MIPTIQCGGLSTTRMATAYEIRSPTAGETQAEALASTHRLKLKPPTYDGNYATFEEWKYKFSAYMGLQDNIFPQLLSRAERATTVLTDAELLGAATTIEEGEKWTQLCNNLKYILINITSGPAATICRQYQDAMGLEVYRQLCNRFATPVGTRSIGYLTKLLKPTFDTNNFEESFSTWEFELARYERDNNAQLPDQVKIAVLMNETTGALQQHLHLNASATPTYAEVRTTIMEYYRTTTAFSRLQQQSSSAVSSNLGGGPAPMDIGATYKGKGKGKGKSKGKGFNKGGHKGKGYHQGRLRRLRQLQQRKGQRKTTAMVSAKRSRERKQRKVERSSQQRKRKESNSNMLQMWSTRPLGKGLPNSGVQHCRDTTGTEPGWNIPMV